MRLCCTLRAAIASVLVIALAVPAWPQQVAQGAVPPAPGDTLKPPPTTSARRRAAKLYLEGSRLYQNQQFEPALQSFTQAAELDGTNPDYRLAAQVAQSHAVNALLQTAALDKNRGNTVSATASLTHALEVDPGNAAASERLQQVAAAPEPQADSGTALPTPNFAAIEQLAPAQDRHSFHLRTNARQVIQQVFRAWGIDATLDESIRPSTVRLDLDDASFQEATHALGMLTNTFYVAIDPQRALVARDSRELRQRYMRNGVLTLPLSGLSASEMTEFGNLARNVFEIQQAAVDPTAATLTLRGSERSLNAFTATYSNLMQGRSEVLIDVRLLQLAHTNARNTGLQPTQQIGVFNVLAEARSILQANQDLVNQIVAAGLAGPNDIATILGILLASGQISNSLFSGGLVTFGGKCDLTSGGTCSPWAFAASPGPATLHLQVNSSDSRALDNFRLRLLDGEEGTLKSGTRYPIQTSTFSSVSAKGLNIPGLTGAGNSGNLAGLLAALQGSSASIPQIQFEDLGLTLKSRPRVLRSGDVALSLDMKITALTGGTVNGIPVLANRAYSGVVTLPANEAVVIAAEIDKNESRAISGLPGLSEIPGLNNATDKLTERNSSTLLIVLTPHVVRMPHGLGHSPLIPVDRGSVTR